jgi:tetratricopeptide (TPR) repeat protein
LELSPGAASVKLFRLTEPGNKKPLTVWICASLAAVTLAVFWSVTGHEFVDYDDQDYVTENTQVQSGLTWPGAVWAFTTSHAGNWHPLTWLSHMLDAQMFGLNSGLHHLTNLVLHIINCVLLFLVWQRMTASLWRSAFVAALFALHPLHVESVAWVSERKDVLSAFFFILSVGAYLKYVESKDRGQDSGQRSADGSRREGQRSSLAWYGVSLSLLALGLMSKPMLVSVPLVLLLLDYWPLNRFRLSNSSPETSTATRSSILKHSLAQNWPLFREKLPFLALSAASCLVTFFAQRSGGAVGSIGTFPIHMRLINAIVGYGRYLRKLIWPSDLSPFYPYPASWPAWAVAVSAGLLLVLTVAASRLRRSRPYLLTGWLWFLIMLVPVIGLLQVGLQSIADRYTYLPSIGLFIAITWGVGDIVGTRPYARMAAGASAAALLAACAALTAIQARFWKDTETLFAHAIEATSENALAEYTLGAAQVKKGKYDEAFKHFSEAIRIQPNHGEALNNLGLLLVMRGEKEAGIARYRQAVQAKLDSSALHYNLAAALADENKIDEAIGSYNAALRKDPLFFPARCGLGAALLRQGKIAEAKTEYQEVLRRDARNTEALIGLGAAFAAETNQEAAFEWFEKALAINPSDPQAHFEIGNVLLDAGRTDEADAQYSWAARARQDLPTLLIQQAQACAARGDRRGAIARAQAAARLAPGQPAILQFAAAQLMQAGQIPEALKHLREIVRLQPDAPAHYNLAIALTLKGDREASLEHYREAVRQQPDWPVALNDLAWILATDPNPALRNGPEAVRLAEHACDLTQRKEARFLGTLDACYAEVGRFSDAIATAERTRDLALSAGQKPLAEAAEARIKLYQSGQPFRQT